MDELPIQFDPKLLQELVFSRAHPGWLGLRYLDHGENWVDVELPWREDLVGDPEYGMLASGPIFSLLDMAGGMCIWAASETFRPMATLDLRVDYQRPARPRASIIAHAVCYKQTRSAAFVNGIAHDGDPEDPVAHVAAVFMSIPMPKVTVFDGL